MSFALLITTVPRQMSYGTNVGVKKGNFLGKTSCFEKIQQVIQHLTKGLFYDGLG